MLVRHGRKFVMVKFKSDIIWTSNEPITVDLLNFMVFNDIFIDNHFLEAKVANVQSNGSIRESPRWIVNHASFFAREVEITPNTWNYDADQWPHFEGTYSFPGNNYFDDNYKPVVILTPKGNRAFPQSITLKNITPAEFTYTYYILSDEVIDSSRKFFMDILAIGIKPVADNELDSSVDPSP